MPAGRPNEWDLIKLAEELLEWSTEPTAFNLIQFARPRKISVTCLPDWAAINDKFSEALQLAKQGIAMNRFEAAVDGLLPFAEVHRSEHNYDPLHKAHCREEKEFDLQLEIKKLDHAHKLKLNENKELGNQAAALYSEAIKAKSNIRD